MSFDRFWLVTWTTYGTWFPGDDRWSVTPVRDEPGPRKRHNVPGTPIDAPSAGLVKSARALAKGDPVYLNDVQAGEVLDQFHETVRIRGWLLVAIAIMRNHVHAEIGVPGDPEPDTILRDLKAYASRRLNRQWPCPKSGTWWTESGSKRKLKDEDAILAAAKYIRDQELPLVVWIHPDLEKELAN